MVTAAVSGPVLGCTCITSIIATTHTRTIKLTVRIKGAPHWQEEKKNETIPHINDKLWLAAESDCIGTSQRVSLSW